MVGGPVRGGGQRKAPVGFYGSLLFVWPATDDVAEPVLVHAFMMIGTASDRGNFPSTPKDRRELRSGNVTHTFRP